MIKKQFLKTKPVCKATFTLPVEAAPEAETVQLVGDFNDWKIDDAPEMKKQKNGMFKLVLDLETGKNYEYRYLVDGTVWINDWEADEYTPNPYGVDNCVVVASN